MTENTFCVVPLRRICSQAALVSNSSGDLSLCQTFIRATTTALPAASERKVSSINLTRSAGRVRKDVKLTAAWRRSMRTRLPGQRKLLCFGFLARGERESGAVEPIPNLDTVYISVLLKLLKPLKPVAGHPDHTWAGPDRQIVPCIGIEQRQPTGRVALRQYACSAGCRSRWRPGSAATSAEVQCNLWNFANDCHVVHVQDILWWGRTAEKAVSRGDLCSSLSKGNLLGRERIPV